MVRGITATLHHGTSWYPPSRGFAEKGPIRQNIGYRPKLR